jgi:hypothetical protein
VKHGVEQFVIDAESDIAQTYTGCVAIMTSSARLDGRTVTMGLDLTTRKTLPGGPLGIEEQDELDRRVAAVCRSMTLQRTTTQPWTRSSSRNLPFCILAVLEMASMMDGTSSEARRPFL